MRDEYFWERRHALRARVEGMTSPVRCAHCGSIYDLGAVQITARYLDCTMWTSPCCRATVDDRGDTGWKSRKDYEHIKIDKDEWP